MSRKSVVDHNKSIRVMFLRKEHGAPIGCIAIEFVKNENTAFIAYQVSVLNPQDRFERKLARQLVKGRLLEDPFYIGNLPLDLKIHDITRVVMSDIKSNSDLPDRARKAARLWLSSTPPNNK